MKTPIISETKKRWLILISLIILLGFGTYGLYFLYRIDKPKIIKTLPDPFLLNDGTRVQTRQDWMIRREEIKTLLLDIEYGQIPGRPDKISVNLLNSSDLGDGNSLKIIKITLIPNINKPTIMISFTAWIYVPKGNGPFPTIVKVSPDGTGSQEKMSEVILARGYMYVCYNHTELDPDTMGYDINGPCQLAYPSYDWGSIAVWAWGAMRVADVLLQESWVDSSDIIPRVNRNALILTGHSRRGKTALLAGALDERFKMVAPNGSGCCGAGSFLIQGYLAETIADITSPIKFRSWFKTEFSKYASNEQDLPFDQHFLRALVAPRIILSTEAKSDYWSNPIGTQAIYEATIPVYDFLRVGENNAIHYREGTHAFTREDFEALMDFADKMLLGKSISGDFYITPFEINFPIDYSSPI